MGAILAFAGASFVTQFAVGLFFDALRARLRARRQEANRCL